MLHHEEWLRDAKRVPVGHSRRVRHGAEGRKNLVVYNNPDSWSAWCHACHEGGKVYKEVLEKVDEVTPVYKKYLPSTGVVPLYKLSKDKFKNLVSLLHDKHMSTELLRKHNPLYSLEDDRLVFKFDGVTIGRDCTGKSGAKWLRYYHDNPSEFVYLQGSKLFKGYEPVVLVEDLFSAIKVNHYTELSTLCCLGTNIYDSIIRALLVPLQNDVKRLAVLAFDGDDGGMAALRNAIDRCSLRGIPYISIRIPLGLDPKDLNHTELLNIFNLEQYNANI